MAALSNGWYELVTVLARKVEGLGFESWFGHLSKVGILTGLISWVDTA